MVEQRTALANQVRSLLTEYGFAIPVGILLLQQRLPELIEDASNNLTFTLRRLLSSLEEDTATVTAGTACLYNGCPRSLLSGLRSHPCLDTFYSSISKTGELNNPFCRSLFNIIKVQTAGCRNLSVVPESLKLDGLDGSPESISCRRSVLFADHVFSATVKTSSENQSHCAAP